MIEKIYHVDVSQKKAGVTIVIFDNKIITS